MLERVGQGSAAGDNVPQPLSFLSAGLIIENQRFAEPGHVGEGGHGKGTHCIVVEEMFEFSYNGFGNPALPPKREMASFHSPLSTASVRSPPVSNSVITGGGGGVVRRRAGIARLTPQTRRLRLRRQPPQPLLSAHGTGRHRQRAQGARR